MNSIDEYFEFYKTVKGDIEEHMDIIREYAAKSETIVELGVRKLVSTWALLAGYPKKIICVDNVHPKDYGAQQVLNDATESCEKEGIDFSFILADDLTIKLEPMDLLFIDTLHTYEQLTAELKLHGIKAKKYIIFHDTEDIPEMYQAIKDFIKEHNEWNIVTHRKNEHGLTVIERKT